MMNLKALCVAGLMLPAVGQPSNVINIPSGMEPCSTPAADADGDGWGWENHASCYIAEVLSGTADLTQSEQPDGEAEPVLAPALDQLPETPVEATEEATEEEVLESAVVALPTPDPVVVLESEELMPSMIDVAPELIDKTLYFLIGHLGQGDYRFTVSSFSGGSDYYDSGVGEYPRDPLEVDLSLKQGTALWTRIEYRSEDGALQSLERRYTYLGGNYVYTVRGDSREVSAGRLGDRVEASATCSTLNDHPSRVIGGGCEFSAPSPSQWSLQTQLSADRGDVYRCTYTCTSEYGCAAVKVSPVASCMQ